MKNSKQTRYWLVPTKKSEQVKRLVVGGNIWSYGIDTPGRRMIKPDDWACFRVKGVGVVAHARVTSIATEKHHPLVKNPELYPWIFNLTDISEYLDKPVKITKDLRQKLDYFQKDDPIETKNLIRHWGVFVQNNKEITEHDFKLLTKST